MMLVSIAPGAPSRVRVYSCTHRARRIITDVRFDRTPNADEVAELQSRPLDFVRAIDGGSAA